MQVVVVVAVAVVIVFGDGRGRRVGVLAFALVVGVFGCGSIIERDGISNEGGEAGEGNINWW